MGIDTSDLTQVSEMAFDYVSDWLSSGVFSLSTTSKRRTAFGRRPVSDVKKINFICPDIMISTSDQYDSEGKLVNLNISMAYIQTKTLNKINEINDSDIRLIESLSNNMTLSIFNNNTISSNTVSRIIDQEVFLNQGNVTLNDDKLVIDGEEYAIVDNNIETSFFIEKINKMPMKNPTVYQLYLKGTN